MSHQAGKGDLFRHKPATRRPQQECSVLVPPGVATDERGSPERRRGHHVTTMSGEGGPGDARLCPGARLPLFAMTDASPVSERLTLSISLLGLQAAGAAGQHGASGTQHRELEGVVLMGSGPASPQAGSLLSRLLQRAWLPAGACGRGCAGQLVALMALVLPVGTGQAGRDSGQMSQSRRRRKPLRGVRAVAGESIAFTERLLCAPGGRTGRDGRCRPSDGATGPDSTLCRPGLRSPAPGGTGHRLAAVPRAGLGAFAPSLLGGRTPPSVEPVLAPAFPRSLLGSPNPPACVCVCPR